MPAERPLEDVIRLDSIGVDIGSSTSHFVVSRLELHRRESRYILVGRDVQYESDVILTPYVGGLMIDANELSRFFETEYNRAGLSPAAIDTGAVILTGYALQRENSEQIARMLASLCGSFVAVSAGDVLEARLAAHGAGAPALASQLGKTIIHVDVGGGTTKLAWCSERGVEQLAAIDVGGRLIQIDATGRMAAVEDAGRQWLDELGATIGVGDRIPAGTVDGLAARMAAQVVAHAQGDPCADPRLLRAGGLLPGWTQCNPPPAITFSGGVAEYVYGRERRSFGDIGAALGNAIRHAVVAAGMQLEPVDAGIRATVLGSSQASMQLSGNTVFVSPGTPLPQRDVPIIVANVDLSEAELSADRLITELRESVGRSGVSGRGAFAVRWKGSATYARLAAMTDALAAVASESIQHGEPVVVVVDGDVAGLVGVHLADRLGTGRSVIALDSLDVAEMDYLDIGSLVPHTSALPVIVKSLIFPKP